MIWLENEYLRARIALRGGELQSLQSAEGLEYIWQGDPEFWPMHGPNLFPVIGRTGSRGLMAEGRIFDMPMHGFLMRSDLEPEEIRRESCVLSLHSSKVTHVWYPYDFALRLHYILQETSLTLRCIVKNTDVHRMYYAIGGHPGFRVPLSEHSRFADCRLQFHNTEEPHLIGFTAFGHPDGTVMPFPLEKGKSLPLHHGLFDKDAVVLKNTGGCVTLMDLGCGHGVTMCYEDFPYLGLWHNPGREAPFLCLEPWSSLPAPETDVEHLDQKPDICILEPGESRCMEWSLHVF